MKTITIVLPIIGYILIAVAIIGVIVTLALKKSKKINKKISNIISVVLIVVAIIGGIFAFSLKSNSKPSSSSSNGGVSYGQGGYEMPNGSDDSFADYVQRVDPDLYNAMQDRYNEAVGK